MYALAVVQITSLTSRCSGSCQWELQVWLQCSYRELWGFDGCWYYWSHQGILLHSLCSRKFLFFLLAHEKSVLQNQVVRCCLEHAASVAKTFITSDAVVVDIKVPEQAPAANPMGGGGSGIGTRNNVVLIWRLVTCWVIGMNLRWFYVQVLDSRRISGDELPLPACCMACYFWGRISFWCY